MVGIGLRDSPDAMRAFAREFGIDFPLWIDPEGEGREAFRMWGHPSTVLLDRAGRIVGRIRRERDWGSGDARRLVQWLLGTGP
jgi:peroxiredoxin